MKASAKRMPLSLLSTYAKMSINQGPAQPQKLGGNRYSAVQKRKVVTYTLPNGQVITSEGLPDALADEEFEKVLVALEDKDQAK